MKYLRQLHVAIDEPSNVAEARRQAVSAATTLKFSETRAAEVGLTVTEAVTNILKHAGHGHIFIACIEHKQYLGIEIIAVDSGPGIANLEHVMQDGNSTSGTYGIGFGAIRRLANEFAIYAQHGTAIRFVIWNNPFNTEPSEWEIGAISIPIQGEQVCGDQWCFIDKGAQKMLAVVDGLGHGPDAAIAATAAVDTLHEHFPLSPSELMRHSNVSLRNTRGAAVAIANFDCDNAHIDFAGIGNICVTLFNRDKHYHLVSLGGIVGANPRKVQEFPQTLEPEAMVIAHSDGLATRWDLQDYPGLRDAHPSLVAAIIFRDFNRGRDDATLVVLRYKGQAL